MANAKERGVALQYVLDTTVQIGTFSVSERSQNIFEFQIVSTLKIDKIQITIMMSSLT